VFVCLLRYLFPFLQSITGTVDILSLLTALIVQRKSCPLAWTHGFVIGLVKSVLNLPKGQVKYSGGIQVTDYCKTSGLNSQ